MITHSDHTAACNGEGCYCPEDVFWARLLGDDDPCAPGRDWTAAAFTEARRTADTTPEGEHPVTAPLWLRWAVLVGVTLGPWALIGSVVVWAVRR